MAVLCWTVLYLMDDIDWTTREPDTMNIALIQGGIPQAEKWKPQNRLYTRELYLELTKPYLHGDLIIWPETAVPSYLHNAADFIRPVQEIISQHQVDLITGIPIKNNTDHRYYNSVISISDHSQRYDKRHLVPFGEYIPVPALLVPLFKFLEIPMSDFSPGNSGKPVLTIRNRTIGVSICYEDVFGEEVIDALPDADILVNVSNDAWFGDSAAPHQHLQMSRLRALETGRYMLRATNTGISAIIDHRGKIIARTGQFVADSLSGEVLLFSGSTPYARWGNKIVLIPVLLLLLYLFIKNRKNRVHD